MALYDCRQINRTVTEVKLERERTVTELTSDVVHAEVKEADAKNEFNTLQVIKYWYQRHVGM